MSILQGIAKGLPCIKTEQKLTKKSLAQIFNVVKEQHLMLVKLAETTSQKADTAALRTLESLLEDKVTVEEVTFATS